MQLNAYICIFRVLFLCVENLFHDNSCYIRIGPVVLGSGLNWIFPIQSTPYSGYDHANLGGTYFLEIIEQNVMSTDCSTD